MSGVDLIINCYERTYRQVLAPGFFPRIVQENHFSFAGRIALINNVVDEAQARSMAASLVTRGEIDSFFLVRDLLPEALAVTGLRGHALRKRPYFLDYGLAMSIAGSAKYVLGWDAEVRLARDADWISPAVELLETDSKFFSAAPRWPRRNFDSLPAETVESRGEWALNWAFSDQVFLVRRSELAAPIYRRFAPASMARHSRHPFTFEARLEAYQRSSQRFRATHSTVEYTHNDLSPVIPRLDGYSVLEKARLKLLEAAHSGLRDRFRHPLLRIP